MKNFNFLREDLFFFKNARNFAENFAFYARRRFSFFFRKTLVCCVLGPWSWPQKGLSSESPSLASGFVSSTAPLLPTTFFFSRIARQSRYSEYQRSVFMLFFDVLYFAIFYHLQAVLKL